MYRVVTYYVEMLRIDSEAFSHDYSGPAVWPWGDPPF